MNESVNIGLRSLLFALLLMLAMAGCGRETPPPAQPAVAPTAAGAAAAPKTAEEVPLPPAARLQVSDETEGDWKKIDRIHELMVAASDARRSGDEARCRRSLRSVLQIEPGHASARHQLGLSHWRSGEREEALRELENGMRRNPGHGPTRRAFAILARKLGRNAKALKAAEPLAFKGDHEASLLYADLLAATGDTEGAISAYRRIVKLRPRDTTALQQLAQLTVKAGRTDEALAAYILLSRAQPRDADAHFNVAVLHHRRGELRQAAAAYERVDKLRPGGEAARQAKSLRAELARRAQE